MTGAVRVILRGTRLTAVTLVWLVRLLTRDLAAGWTGDVAARRRRNRQVALRGWCVAVCRALAVQVEVRGEPPREPCFLVCNHLGYLDIPVLGSRVDTVFVSKSEVADWPIIGALATLAGTIYVERERKRKLPEVNAQIREALNRGDGVVVFPEGTSSGGDSVLEFRPSLLASAAELGLAVHMAGLVYTSGPGDPDARESVCWWRDMAFFPHVLRLLQLSEIHATLSFVAQPVQAADRKYLAQSLWRGVSEVIRSPA